GPEPLARRERAIPQALAAGEVVVVGIDTPASRARRRRRLHGLPQRVAHHHGGDIHAAAPREFHIPPGSHVHLDEPEDAVALVALELGTEHPPEFEMSEQAGHHVHRGLNVRWGNGLEARAVAEIRRIHPHAATSLRARHPAGAVSESVDEVVVARRTGDVFLKLHFETRSREPAEALPELGTRGNAERLDPELGKEVQGVPGLHERALQNFFRHRVRILCGRDGDGAWVREPKLLKYLREMPLVDEPFEGLGRGHAGDESRADSRRDGGHPLHPRVRTRQQNGSLQGEPREVSREILRRIGARRGRRRRAKPARTSRQLAAVSYHPERRARTVQQPNGAEYRQAGAENEHVDFLRHGMNLTMRGPMTLATGTGRNFQSRGPQLYAPSSGEGVVAAPCAYHQSGSSREPHCRLKRCVPESGVQRPKLKSVTPCSTQRSRNPQ